MWIAIREVGGREGTEAFVRCAECALVGAGLRTDFIQAFHANDPTLRAFQAQALVVHEKVHEKVDGKSR